MKRKKNYKGGMRNGETEMERKRGKRGNGKRGKKKRGKSGKKVQKKGKMEEEKTGGKG